MCADVFPIVQEDTNKEEYLLNFGSPELLIFNDDSINLNYDGLQLMKYLEETPENEINLSALSEPHVSLSEVNCASQSRLTSLFIPGSQIGTISGGEVSSNQDIVGLLPISDLNYNRCACHY